MSKIKEDLKSGKNDLINWIKSDEYRIAAEANVREAEKMGLKYIPTYKYPEFKEFEKFGSKVNFVIEPDNNAMGWVGISSGSPIVINLPKAKNIRTIEAHEAAHNFRDTNPDNIALISNRLKLSDLYVPDEKFYLLEEINALDEAYSFVSEGRFSNMLKTLGQQIAEKASTNTELQYAIWKLSKAKTVSELNAAIDKLSDDDILYMLQLTNGYGNDFVNYIASNPNTKSQAVSNIRKALKYVPVMAGVTRYGGYKLYENLNKQ